MWLRRLLWTGRAPSLRARAGPCRERDLGVEEQPHRRPSSSRATAASASAVKAVSTPRVSFLSLPHPVRPGSLAIGTRRTAGAPSFAMTTS